MRSAVIDIEDQITSISSPAGRDDAIPCRLDEFAFRLHLRADGVHQVDLEADPLPEASLLLKGG